MSHLRLNLVLLAGLLLCGSASVFSGSGGAGLSDLLAGDDGLAGLVLWELRLPRVLLGALVGAGLGASGAVLQGFLRNPLADPGVIGVSASAGLSAKACSVRSRLVSSRSIVCCVLPICYARQAGHSRASCEILLDELGSSANKKIIRNSEALFLPRCSSKS